MLAKLYLDAFRGKVTPKAVRKAIEGLSASSGALSYDKAYEKTMEQINGQPEDMRDLGLKMLLILTSARRPLTANELCHALAVEPHSAGFDQENIPELEIVLSACAGVVTYQPESQIVQIGPSIDSGVFCRRQSTVQMDPESRGKNEYSMHNVYEGMRRIHGKGTATVP